MTPRDKICVRVIYGQFSKGPLSAGFIAFAGRLRGMGYLIKDDITWDEPDVIIKDIHDRRHLGHREVLIGHSLGALCTSWVASAGQAIELICAYDPSGGWGPFVAEQPNPIAKNVKRCLCYLHTIPEPIRRAPLVGNNVEIIYSWAPHMFMQGNETLHQTTLRALADVEKT